MKSGRDTSHHHCHAIGCVTPCKPEHLMCGRHWRMVPFRIQAPVYAAYRPGQCDDMNVSPAWLTAAKAAIRAVAETEDVSTATILREMGMWDDLGDAVRRSPA